MKNDKKKIVSIAGILFLVIFVVAISYAAFSYSKIGRENKITTGTISMNYTEANNGLTINEAVPTTDEEGKILISPGQVFDFTVSIDIVGDFQVSYEVVAEKQASSTLDEKYVKLYLERGLDGTNYSEIMEPSIYVGIEKASEFGAPTGSMIMDTGTVSSSTLYYYRLRMWLDESYELTSEAKSFTVKVNVYGTTEKYKLDNEGFACTFSDNDTLSVGNKSTVDLICTDQTSGVEKKQLAISDFVNSDSEVGEIKEISNPIKINGGYKYTLTLQGKKAGEFKLTLPEGKISDRLGNKNTEQSKTYNVSNTIYRITYKIGKNVETIEKESDSCIVNADGKCEVTLPSITPKAGYTSLGWSTEENSDTEGYKENTKYEVTSSTVLYAHAKDITAPKVVMEIEGDEQYDQNKEVKVDIVEEAGEISDDGTVAYGWSTSKDIEPTTWTTVTFAEMEKTTGKYTFKATATNLTGEYYLFVKANLKDSVGNISNETKISTSTFKFDNVKPICKITGDNTIMVEEAKELTLTCTDENSKVIAKDLDISNIEISNDTGKILLISAATKTENGYKYQIKLKGLTTGSFNVSLKAGIISDSAGNKNEKVTSETIEVTGRTYTATYQKGNNIESISRESDTCTTTGSNTSCEITLPEIVASVGYSPAGWYNEDKSKQTAPNAKYTLTKDETLTAEAVVNSYKVTYDYMTNGGSAVSQKEDKVNYNSAVDLNVTATKDGWTFVGWNTDKDATIGLTSLKIGTEDVTLYAIFKKEVTATFTYYDSGLKNATTSCVMYNNETVCNYEIPTVVTSSAGPSETVYKGVSTKTSSTDLTTTYNSNTTKYYAVYDVVKSATYYYYNGTTQTSTTASATRTALSDGTTYKVTEGKITIPEEITKSIGPSNATYSGIASSVSQTTSADSTTANSKYYAYYSGKWNIKYAKGAGVNTIGSTGTTCDSNKVSNGTTYQETSCEVTLPEITAESGYTVTGWYEGSTKVGNAGAKYTVSKDVTLTAQTNINAYTVTYDYMTNGGSAVSQKEDKVNYNSAVDLNVTATKDGWTFVGWNTDKDATIGLTSLKIGTEDVTLYAIFKKEVTATFTYYDSGLKNATTSCVMYNNETVCNYEIPTVVTSSAGPSETVYKGVSTKTSSTDLTTTYNSNTTKYYAVYDVVKSATYYYYNGTTQTSTTASATRTALSDGTTYKVTEGKITIPEEITKSIGPSNATYSGIASSVSQTTSADSTTANSKYYAYYSGKWNIKYAKGAGVNTIGSTGTTCDSNKVSNGTTYQETSCEVTLPEITAESGYTVTGWYEGSTKVGNAGAKYTVSKDVTLTAQTNINAYTVTYDYTTNGGNSATKTSATVNYNSAIDLSVTATKTGYTFVGWNTNKDATTALTSLKMGTSNITLYAIFKDATAPVCSFGTAPTIKYGSTGTITLTCTDNEPGMSSHTIATSDLTVSNSNGSITAISAPTAVTKGYTYTVTLKGLTVGTFTVSLNEKVISDKLGNTNVKATSSNVTVEKISAVNPTLTAYTGTYDGSSHTIEVSGGSGGTIQYSTDNSTWSTTKPTRTNAGTTTVYVRVLGDSNHNTTSSISANITIARKSIEVPTCTAKTYTGVSQTLFSSGTGYTAGGTTSGIDAGTYTATATPTGNYMWSDGTTTAKNVSCKINAKSVAVSWGTTTTFTYSGSAQGPTVSAVTGVNGETVNFTRTTATNAGSYTSTASCSSVTGGRAKCANYSLSGATKAYTISKKSMTKPTSPTAKNYTGSSQTSGITCPTGSTAGGTTSATNAGTYSQTCTPDSNHIWSDNTTTAVSISWTINKVAATLTCSNKTYSGVSQTGCTCSGGTIGGTYSGIDVGTYTASCTADSNHTSPANKSWSVLAKSVAVSWGTTTTFTYSGSAQGPTVSAVTGVNGETVNFTRTTATNAGSYTSTASCSSVTGGRAKCANYSLSGATKAYTISKKSMTKPTSPTAKNYTGSSQTSGITCPTGSTAGGTTSATNAGTYSQTCTPDSNHMWSDNTTAAASISWTINKIAAVNPTLTAYTGTYDGSSHTIGVSGGSGGTIQYSTNNSTWTTTKPTRTDAGTTTVYVRVLGDSNHNTTSSINAKITINKKTPTVVLTPSSGKATKASSQTTFEERADVAGKFSNTSGAASIVSVAPATYTDVAANTSQTVHVAGLATGTGNVVVTFTPTSSNYATVTKTYSLTSDITLPTWSLVSATTETISKTATPLETITLKIKGTDDSGSSTSTLTNDNIKVYINGSLVTPSSKGISATAGVTGGKEYTILISGINSAGSMTVMIDAGTLTDAVGNASAKASITTGITIRKYTASEVTYSGTSSGSSCTSVQCALDEISKKVS